MKKQFFFIMALIVFGCNGCAQKLAGEIPMDPAIRHGRLDNGLTYYIVRNDTEKGTASFNFVTRACTMLETPGQYGMMHFLEHMSYNTANFPENIFSFVKRYGGGTNAHAAFDNTYYELDNIQIKNDGVLDSCLLIMYDWSGYIKLTDELIDSEREVIREEIRLSSGAEYRMGAKIQHEFLAGTPYSVMLSPLGPAEIIENFTYDELRECYNQWYRHPEIQAVIIAGDIDVDEIEMKVKELFSKIPGHATKTDIKFPPVPDNDEPIICIATDPEAIRTEIKISYKHDKIPLDALHTIEEQRLKYIQYCVSKLMENRLHKLAGQNDTPFNSAGAYDGTYLMPLPKHAWNLYAEPINGRVEEAFTLLLKENRQAEMFGFTVEELEDLKSVWLKTFEKRVGEAVARDNYSIVEQCRMNFIRGELLVDPKFEYRLAKEIISRIDTATVNSYMRGLITDKNITVSVSGPAEMDYPSEENIIKMLYNKDYPGLEPYRYKALEETLLTRTPVAGKIVKEETDPAMGTKIWTLSNGATVVLKKTDFEDKIYMSATSVGYGIFSLPESEALYASHLTKYTKECGLGKFSAAELDRYLSGRNTEVVEIYFPSRRGLRGYSTNEDMEILFQLTHAMFVEPHRDEKAFGNYKNKLMQKIENRIYDYSAILKDSISFAEYGNKDPFSRSATIDQIKSLDMDKLLSLRKEYYGDAGSFIFSFAGNIDEKQFGSLLEQYIASLPSLPHLFKTEAPTRIDQGSSFKRFEVKMQDVKATVYNQYTATIDRDSKIMIQLKIFRSILESLCSNAVRGPGGAYHISVDFGFNLEDEAVAIVSFDTDPAKAEAFNKVIAKQMQLLADNGPDVQMLKNAKTEHLNNYNNSVRSNIFWCLYLDQYYREGRNDHPNDDITVINSTTAEDIKAIAQTFIGNHINILMIGK